MSFQRHEMGLTRDEFNSLFCTTTTTTETTVAAVEREVVIDMTVSDTVTVSGIHDKDERFVLVSSLDGEKYGNQEEELGCFCGACLKELSDLHFLMQMKHVKECQMSSSDLKSDNNNKENRGPTPGVTKARKGIVPGDVALELFLVHHYGYDERVLKMFVEAGVKSLNCILKMCSRVVEELEALPGLEGLSGKKRLVFALEQYVEQGCVKRGGTRKSVLDVERKKVVSRDRGKVSKSLKELVARDSRERGIDMMVENVEMSLPRHRRRVEMTLLDVLYRSSSGSSDKIDAVRHHGGGKSSMLCSYSRVESVEQSLWFATHGRGLLIPECGTLEERIQRRGNDARGFDGRRDHEVESVAMKQVRLKAMQEELRAQKMAVSELERMIVDLEQEINAEMNPV
jgi:hypothetical protein